MIMTFVDHCFSVVPCLLGASVPANNRMVRMGLGKQCRSRSDCSSRSRHDKTCCLGFRPGPTQTGLYSHRRWLEA